jgi:hypothetical protein
MAKFEFFWPENSNWSELFSSLTQSIERLGGSLDDQISPGVSRYGDNLQPRVSPVMTYHKFRMMVRDQLREEIYEALEGLPFEEGVDYWRRRFYEGPLYSIESLRYSELAEILADNSNLGYPPPSSFEEMVEAGAMVLDFPEGQPSETSNAFGMVQSELKRVVIKEMGSDWLRAGEMVNAVSSFLAEIVEVVPGQGITQYSDIFEDDRLWEVDTYATYFGSPENPRYRTDPSSQIATVDTYPENLGEYFPLMLLAIGRSVTAGGAYYDWDYEDVSLSRLSPDQMRSKLTDVIFAAATQDYLPRQFQRDSDPEPGRGLIPVQAEEGSGGEETYDPATRLRLEGEFDLDQTQPVSAEEMEDLLDDLREMGVDISSDDDLAGLGIKKDRKGLWLVGGAVLASLLMKR